MNKAIIQSYNSSMSEVSALTLENHQRYAKLYNWDFIRYYSEDPDYNMHTKFNDIVRLGKEYDLVWGLDIDVVIRDYSIDLLDLIDENYALNICSSHPFPTMRQQVNAGSFVYNKQCNWDYVRKYPAPNDQGSFWQALEKEDDFYNNTRVHQYDKFNHDGDFLKHFCYDCNKSEEIKKELEINNARSFFSSIVKNKQRYAWLYDTIKADSVLEVGSNPMSLKKLKLFFGENVEGLDLYQDVCIRGCASSIKLDKKYDLIIDDCFKDERQIITYLNLSRNCNQYIVEGLSFKDCFDFFKEEGFLIKGDIGYKYVG